MPSKPVIIEVIAQLTPQQSRGIKEGLRGNRKRLFNFLCSQKEFSSLEEAQVFMGLDDKGFAVLKSQLEKRVLKLLGEMSAKERPSERIGAVALQAKGYHLFGFHQKAIHHYVSAFAMALEFEELQCAASILATIQVYWPRSCSDSMMEANEILRGELHSSQALLRSALAVKSLRGQERLDEARSLLARIIELPIPASKKARIFHTRARIIGLGILRDYDALLPICVEIESVVDDNPWLLWDAEAFSTIQTVRVVQSAAMNILGNIREGLSNLERFIDILSHQRIPVPQGLRLRQQILSIDIALKENDNAFVSDMIAELRLDLMKSEGSERKDSLEKAELYVQVALIFFSNRDFLLAEEWFGKVRTLRITGRGDHWYVFSAILEVFCIAELNHDTALEGAIRRAGRRFSKSGVHGNSANILMDAFRNLHQQPELKREIYLTLEKKLSMLSEKNGLQLVYEIFDFKSWLRTQA